MILLLALHAHAATPVLVSSWQPRNPDAAGLAGLIEDYLAREIARDPELSVLRVEDSPSFKDYPARTYMDGCPPGDIVGCTQVVAQRTEAEFAVTGTVQALADYSRIEVEVLDVRGSRVMLSFRSDLAVGEDQVFAEGVARVVSAAVRGEAGQEQDIREGEEEDATPVDKDLVASQLRELESQLSEASLAIGEGGREIPETTYTLEDLTERMQTEGAKPWDRLGMTPGAYLRYKNSGLPLVEWRRRAVGREGQLLIRGNGTYWNGPVKGSFYARYAVGDGLQTVDSYAYQAVETGSAAGGALGLAWGVLPWLDVGVQGGVVTGRFVVDVNEQQADRPEEYNEPIPFFVTHVVAGPRAQATFLPVSPVRPTAGLGVDWVQQHAVGEFYDMPASVHTFPARHVVVASLVPGGEATLSRRLDFFLKLPIDLGVAGTQAQVERTGSEEVVTPLSPPAAPTVAWRLEAGLQVRLFGKDVEKEVVYDDFEEP